MSRDVDTYWLTVSVSQCTRFFPRMYIGVSDAASTLNNMAIVRTTIILLTSPLNNSFSKHSLPSNH